MRVLVTGSTTWLDAQALHRELSLLPTASVIVTGDTPGIDALAQEVALTLGFQIEAMKKQKSDYRSDELSKPREGWKGLNQRMIATGIDLVLAFHADYGKPGCARGTQHAVGLAEAAGIAVRIFRC